MSSLKRKIGIFGRLDDNVETDHSLPKSNQARKRPRREPLFKPPARDPGPEASSSKVAADVHRDVLSDSDEGEEDDFEARRMYFNAVEQTKLEEKYRKRVENEIEAGKYRKGIAAQHGILESVEMHQFMCHKWLSFKFGDKINFIIGRNGSGKSAILAAVTVALGGRANTTGRGNGLKSFIREGQSASEVTVVLKNAGEDAFKPDKYGPRIIVTRRFNKQGASSYKISGVDGKVQSTKRAELEAICDHMAIQVDNPISILNQEASKRFLSGSSPEYHYELFLRATLLRQLEEEYALIAENVRVTTRVVDQNVKSLFILQEKLDRARERHAEVEKVQELRARQEVLRGELAWASVAETQAEVEEKFQTVTDLEFRINKIKEVVKKADADVAASRDKLHDLQSEFDVAKRSSMELKKTYESFKVREQTKRKELTELKHNEKIMSSQMETIQQDLLGYDGRIQEATKILVADAQPRERELQTQIDACKSSIADIENELGAAKQEHSRLQNERNNLDGVIRETEGNVGDADVRITELEAAVRECERRRLDHLSVFANNLPEVFESIRKEKWSGRSPVGPLGLYVELENLKKWGELMRVTIGHQMRAFAITDARDLLKLRAILSRTNNSRTQVIIYGYDLFDYKDQEPPPEFPTALRLLRIKDEYVLRVLINSKGIERTYITTTRDDAEGLMDIRGSGTVWTSDLRRVTRWKADGGRKSENLQAVRASDVRFGLFRETGASSQLQEIQDELLKVQHEKDVSFGQLGDYRARKMELQRALRQNELSQTNMKGILGEKQAFMQNQIGSLEEGSYQARQMNIAAVQELKIEKEDEKQHLMSQFKALKENQAVLQLEISPLTEEIKSIREQQDKTEADERDASERIQLATEDQVKALHYQEHFQQRLNIEEARLETLRNAATEVEALFLKRSEVAERICDRIESPRSRNDVGREVDAITRALSERERRNGRSETEAATELRNAELALKTTESDTSGLLILNERLKKSMAKRHKKWFDWRAYCSMNCKMRFQYNLCNRGYYGQVHMDHQQQKLQIKVQTDDQIEFGRDKDPASLSGGEKSFATISLLLALWETVGCSIRCLDEFDVFMDAVNRKISMKMLIENAKASQGKQHILITPLEMPESIRPSDDVIIRRMPDPERSVTQDS